MKPLQHAQISQKTYGGQWTDYIEVHNFLDSSKATCAHFKHRFLLHHVEGIELGVRIFGETLTNSEYETTETFINVIGALAVKENAPYTVLREGFGRRAGGECYDW